MNDTGSTLTEQLGRPGWHAYQTQPSGHLWACTCHTPQGCQSSGVTVDADTIDGLRKAVEAAERTWPLRVAA